MSTEASGLRVLIAGGGTGGHVVPALAVARHLRDHFGAEVLLVGTPRGIEGRLVPQAGFALHMIQVGQLANMSLMARLRTVTGLPVAVRECVRLLRSFRPAVVLGVGGYASGPAMLAALLLRVPTAVYEPNAVPGMVNRALGKRVSAAAVAFAETLPYFRKGQVTGVPVREAIFAAGPLPVRSPRLLVTAGSNGARVFNESLPRVMPALLAAVPGLTVMHQTGHNAFAATEQAYCEAGVSTEAVEVQPFLPDMPEQLARATLVLARSGSTVAELAAAGRPSLLVPFPLAAADHQRRNAEAMVKAGAARMLLQAELTPERLQAELTGMLRDEAALLAMAEAARGLARPEALREIAALLLRVAGRNVLGAG